jgi:prepilin-type N-terminal cleavage/methylation domain-containing protein
MSKPRGFTLLETIVALAVTSILLAGLVPLITRTSSRAREQETIAAMLALKESIAGTQDSAGFIASMGRLPRSLDELLASPLSGRAGLGGLPVGWVGPYLSSGNPDPLRDGWGRPYLLDFCSAPGSWRLRSLGPDGPKSTDDDLVVPPQGCFLSSGTLRLEILRDTAGAPGSPAGALAVTLYYALDGEELPLPGTAAGNFVSFPCGGADCQIPLGTHAVSVQLDGGPLFWRNVSLTRAVNSASLAFPFPPRVN